MIRQMCLFGNTDDSSLTAADSLFPDKPARVSRKSAHPRRLGNNRLLRMCVLGSGSGGNCTVIQHGDFTLMIDAGFGPRTIAQRLAQIELSWSSVRALCLTHLDQDHFRPHLIDILAQHGVSVYLHRWHAAAWRRMDKENHLQSRGLLHHFGSESFGLDGWPEATLTPTHLPHDQKGTTGYRLDTPDGSIGLATDLGRVSEDLVACFSGDGGVDVLAIESNYDPIMQRNSSRPAYLKERIMGGQGHLSNQQSFEAVKRIVQSSAAGRPGRVVLLHRSAQCNCPTIVQRVFEQDPAIARRVMLTQQRRRTPWIMVQPPSAAAQNQMAFDES